MGLVGWFNVVVKTVHVGLHSFIYTCIYRGNFSRACCDSKVPVVRLLCNCLDRSRIKLQKSFKHLETTTKIAMLAANLYLVYTSNWSCTGTTDAIKIAQKIATAIRL